MVVAAMVLMVLYGWYDGRWRPSWWLCGMAGGTGSVQIDTARVLGRGPMNSSAGGCHWATRRPPPFCSKAFSPCNPIAKCCRQNPFLAHLCTCSCVGGRGVGRVGRQSSLAGVESAGAAGIAMAKSAIACWKICMCQKRSGLCVLHGARRVRESRDEVGNGRVGVNGVQRFPEVEAISRSKRVGEKRESAGKFHFRTVLPRDRGQSETVTRTVTTHTT